MDGRKSKAESQYWVRRGEIQEGIDGSPAGLAWLPFGFVTPENNLRLG